MPPPRVPPLFSKYNHMLARQNAVIELPLKKISFKCDYETELFIVIGKRTRNVSEADALAEVQACLSTIRRTTHPVRHH